MSSDAKSQIGHQLRLVQAGLEPDDWKPMASVGQGVCEIRVNAGGAYRALYFAKSKVAVFVLHVFEKKSRATANPDIALGRKRYAQMKAEQRQSKS